MSFKEWLNKQIERIEDVLNVLLGGLLGGLVTYLVIESETLNILSWMLGFIVFIIFIKLIKKFYLDR